MPARSRASPPASGIHDLVTDSAADPAALEALRESGVRIHLADLDPVHQEAEQA